MAIILLLSSVLKFATELRNDGRGCFDPKFPEGHNNLGLALLQEGDAGTARAEFVEAVRLKPGYAEAHCNLGLALHQEEKEDEARAEFEKAYEISPELRNAPHP